MKYLIEGFVAGIRQYMERAVEDDNDVNQISLPFTESIDHAFLDDS